MYNVKRLCVVGFCPNKNCSIGIADTTSCHNTRMINYFLYIGYRYLAIFQKECILSYNAQELSKRKSIKN